MNEQNNKYDIKEYSKMLIGRINKNRRRFKGWIKQNSVTCYRLYNHDIPQIPLIIDWYDGRINCYILTDASWSQSTHLFMSSLALKAGESLRVAQDNIFIKYRKHSKGGEQYGRIEEKNLSFNINEDGLLFTVNLSDRIDTGLFLDHRITRKLIRKESKGRRVLNLFAYTGSFSVYAAAGGAKITVTADLSNTYLDVAKKNMELNGFTGFNHRFLKADVLAYLKDPPDEKFDLIILDPPTVSTSKAMDKKLVIKDDHKWMIESALKMLSKGGVLYFSSNFRQFKLNENISAAKIEEITGKTVPPDFAGKRPHRCYRIEK